MNPMQILSLFIGLAVTIIGLYVSSNKNILMFYDGISLFIVIGGTLAATSISVKIPRMLNLLKIFFSKMIKGKTVNFQSTISQLLKLSDAIYSGQDLNSFKDELKDPFLIEALNLYLDEIVDDDRYIRMLGDRVKNMHKSLMMDVNRLKNIGKYPPAFGMMGTTMGMVVLLAGLGGKDALKTMGPAMAVCLITTLYGVIISNVLIVPISENIDDSAQEIYLKNKIIVEGMKLIFENNPPAVLAEELNSYLDHGDRLDWKEVVSV